MEGHLTHIVVHIVTRLFYFDFVSAMLASRTLPWHHTSSVTGKTWRGESYTLVHHPWLLLASFPGPTQLFVAVSDGKLGRALERVYLTGLPKKEEGGGGSLVFRPSFLPLAVQKELHSQFTIARNSPNVFVMCACTSR